MGPCSSTRLQQWYVTTCAAQCATIQQTIPTAANILCAELFHSPTTIVLAASVRSPRGRGETIQSVSLFSRLPLPTPTSNDVDYTQNGNLSETYVENYRILSF